MGQKGRDRDRDRDDGFFVLTDAKPDASLFSLQNLQDPVFQMLGLYSTECTTVLWTHRCVLLLHSQLSLFVSPQTPTTIVFLRLRHRPITPRNLAAKAASNYTGTTPSRIFPRWMVYTPCWLRRSSSMHSHFISSKYAAGTCTVPMSNSYPQFS